MFKKTLDLIREEFRPYAAFDSVAEVASHHRIQCSPGFRDAAQFIQTSLAADNVAVEILQFPAKQGETWWSQESFSEWACKDAELVLMEDGKRERLCSFAEQKISLVQRSAATPPEGLHTSIVYIEKATEPSSYEGIDVGGKIVFSRGSVTEIAKVAVDKFGAAGIVVDNMGETPGIRDRFTLPNGRQYQSFWPTKPDAHKAFGFMLTPRQGEALRKRFLAGKTELQAFARVDSEFFDGFTEVVQATIPGDSDEEVIAIAHLCHPQASANDNASGCGALMESVRTLQRLIDSGRLPKPRRTIRFLWLAEMSGSYAYLASREADLSKLVAAINLDMVGENQELCGSTFTVVSPVAALPGFGGELAGSILHRMTKELSSLGGNHRYATFRWTISPYSGGSDHCVWGDPTVGATCPMIIQWPDRFYHTSEDTIDKVDPKMLGVTGVLTATYLYIASSATPAHAAFLAGEMATGFLGETEDSMALLTERWGELTTGDDNTEALSKARRAVERRIAFLAQRKAENVKSLRSLAGDSPVLEQATASALAAIDSTQAYLTEKHLQNLATLAGLESRADLPGSWQEPNTDAVERARAIVPVRRFRGPFSSMAKESPAGYDDAYRTFREQHERVRVPSSLLQYWADGKRTLLEIAELVEGESGFYNLQALLDYFELMVMRGIFERT